MKPEQVAALAAGKDDVELYEIGRKYGLLNLACDFDGVDAIQGSHISEMFTRANPFVHLAIREGFVTASVADISNMQRFGGNKVSPSIDHAGEPLPIHRTVFKGEEQAV